ncbi:hypothetical protein H6G33_09695 [Calothrix sp. FACHB-1219]|uniref:hypothetical protein n=1 Tax=unclassified Calothrix TaxID=2619626 RepID=UPI00168831D4|nr:MULTISPECIES: hypothetical protein [unclassified Calothrix]MBD2201620.1 hypothetical protein [Calothrix sp. FACHB-168]MBD2217306.1 hypothetical protein [Calothrix sp. FACHB-1219]
MLVVKFVPTFSENSMLQTAEDVAWQFRGNVVDGEVYVCIDLILNSNKVVYKYQVVKHLMLQLLMFGVGVKGCTQIDKDFVGYACNIVETFKPLEEQLEEIYFRDDKHGIISAKRYQKLNGIPNPYYSKEEDDKYNEKIEKIKYDYFQRETLNILKRYVQGTHEAKVKRQMEEKRFNSMVSETWVLEGDDLVQIK